MPLISQNILQVDIFKLEIDSNETVKLAKTNYEGLDYKEEQVGGSPVQTCTDRK